MYQHNLYRRSPSARDVPAVLRLAFVSLYGFAVFGGMGCGPPFPMPEPDNNTADSDESNNTDHDNGGTTRPSYVLVTKWSLEHEYQAIWSPLAGAEQVALDSQGSVYVVHTDYYQVEKYTSDGALLGKLEGFNWPFGVAIGSSGNIYVGDSTSMSGLQRVCRYSSGWQLISTWGNSARSGSSSDGEFNGVCYLAVDSSGNVYAVDTFNDRIQKFTGDGRFLLKWGNEGTGDGQFRSPWGIAADSAGNIYVTDKDNARVQEFSANGAFLRKWGGYGSAPGAFDGPYGIAVDLSGNVYVVDGNNNRIQKFHGDGSFITQWGAEGIDPLRIPRGIAIDSEGNVYVSCHGGDAVYKYAPSN